MEPRRSTFVGALVGAPAGVALLARLEAEHRSDLSWFESPGDSDHGAVVRAVAAVDAMSFGRLVALAVEAAETLAGPWMPGAPDALAKAYRQAEHGRPITEAIVARFGARLHAPVGLGAQQWWHTDNSRREFNRTLFRDFGCVYGNGELTWAGLRTATDPPAEAHDVLWPAWEMVDAPISRWHLPVRIGARVWEIHRPGDWVRLVEAYPCPARRGHDGWELPGPNQHDETIAGLLATPGQHAVRAEVERHVLPDWAAVAADYDGVHLSWAGLLTTEGYVSDLTGGGVTMLRYWSSERTLWLADVFGEPAPLGAPTCSTASDGADARADQVRQAQDLEGLTGLLGRWPAR